MCLARRLVPVAHSTRLCGSVDAAVHPRLVAHPFIHTKYIMFSFSFSLIFIFAFFTFGHCRTAGLCAAEAAHGVVVAGRRRCRRRGRVSGARGAAAGAAVRVAFCWTRTRASSVVRYGAVAAPWISSLVFKSTCLFYLFIYLFIIAFFVPTFACCCICCRGLSSTH